MSVQPIPAARPSFQFGKLMDDLVPSFCEYLEPRSVIMLVTSVCKNWQNNNKWQGELEKSLEIVAREKYGIELVDFFQKHHKPISQLPLLKREIISGSERPHGKRKFLLPEAMSQSVMRFDDSFDWVGGDGGKFGVFLRIQDNRIGCLDRMIGMDSEFVIGICSSSIHGLEWINYAKNFHCDYMDTLSRRSDGLISSARDYRVFNGVNKIALSDLLNGRDQNFSLAEPSRNKGMLSRNAMITALAIALIAYLVFIR